MSWLAWSVYINGCTYTDVKVSATSGPLTHREGLMRRYDLDLTFSVSQAKDNVMSCTHDQRIHAVHIRTTSQFT